MTKTDSAARAAALAEELAEAGERFVAAVAALAPLAEEIADLEARHRAAAHAAGVTHCQRRPARELAAAVLLGRLGALRPYVPQVAAAAADRAARQLTSMCGAGRVAAPSFAETRGVYTVKIGARP
jgi:hypothetical protein